MTKFKRETIFYPAWDKRDEDCGVHGVAMCWYLHGPLGTIQFIVYTGWHLPHVHEDHKARGFEPSPPSGADLGYHRSTPTFEGQHVSSCECLFVQGECYTDGSGLQADEALKLLIAEGSEAVWKLMEERYVLWCEQE